VTSTATQDSPGAGGDRAAGGPTFEINIEGQVYEWNGRTITPADIRELGGLPADQAVIEINFQDNTERTLGESEVVTVKPGHGFGKKIGFKRGGR
jgi:Multiubiquitin